VGSVTEDGDNREPLLVRPFVLQDEDGGAPPPGEPDAATWQAGPAPDSPTQVLPIVPGSRPAPRRPRVRRPVRPALLIGAGVAVVLAVAGYAIVRPALQPTVSTSLPDQSLPVVTGPGDDREESTATSSAATPSATAAGQTTAPAGATAPATSAPAATAPATAPAELIPPSPLIDLQGALTSGNGLCLDLQGGDAADGQDVHVDDCNGTSPQRWRLNGDRTLEVLDMCANLVGDSTVELIGCDTRNTALWSLNRENGQVTNAANGQCLTDPFFGARPGKQVIVARCTGLNNQRWSFN
jgi:hypothetical protein